MQPASNRAYRKLTIECGMLLIPTEVYAGMTDEAGISRKMFTGEEFDHEVGYLLVDKVTDEKVSRSDTVKKVSTEYGYVFVEPHEEEALLNVKPNSLTVKEFLPLSQRDAYVGKKLYFLEPGKDSRKVGGKTVKSANAKAQTLLGLLLESMRQENVFALVEWTDRGAPKPAVLTADGELWTVYFDEELREQRPLDVPDDLPEAHLEQMKSLVAAMSGTEAPVLTDEYSSKIQAFADEKAAAGDFTKPVEVPVAELAADTADFLADLTASVEAARAKKAS